MMRIDFDRAKHFPIESLLTFKSLRRTLQARGSKLVGPCPVHGGDNPNAFVVSRDRNLWYCFSRCAGGGDVVDLLARLDGLSRVESARRILQQWNIDFSTPVTSLPERQETPAKSFRPYIRRLDLNPAHPFLAAKGIRPSTARRFEVGAWTGPGFLSACIGVRLRSVDGHPLGYAGRRLNVEQARNFGKWKMPRGLPKRRVLFGLHRLPVRRRDRVLVVECPWGVLRAAQLSIPAVSLLGTSVSKAQLSELRSFDQVGLMLDGDHAGRQATFRIGHKLKGITRVRQTELPDGHDPDDLTDSDLRRIALSLFL